MINVELLFKDMSLKFIINYRGAIKRQLKEIFFNSIKTRNINLFILLKTHI